MRREKYGSFKIAPSRALGGRRTALQERQRAVVDRRRTFCQNLNRDYPNQHPNYISNPSNLNCIGFAAFFAWF